jgi:hypothetical protein
LGKNRTIKLVHIFRTKKIIIKKLIFAWYDN